MKFFRILFLLFLMPGTLVLFSFLPAEKNTPSTSSKGVVAFNSSEIYYSLDLYNLGLSYEAFNLALQGMKKLQEAGRVAQCGIISIADMSQSSSKKRLYIIDLDQQQLLFQTYVAHGRNSGQEFAESFSNQPSSYKSSLGFYTTLDTYMGDHGLSLRLMGEEPGINNNAFDRAIVMHGADYANAEFIRENGRLGRSQGCPAIPANVCSHIVNVLKNGSCLFLYYPDKKYLATSQLLLN
ncbi:MAG: murein L,D-transpeptidase catalytic domain family protein [Chitinophagales bacterium]